MPNQESMKQGWYLLKSKTRQEQRAVENLENQDFEVYCPMIQERCNDVALFPGYLFLRLGLNDLDRYHKIRSTRGVIEVVHFNRMNRKLAQSGQLSNCSVIQLMPQPIPNGDDIIDLIEEIVHFMIHGQDNSPVEVPRFNEGDQVCYNNPLFQHLKATFVKEYGDQRGLILIHYIQNQRGIDGIEKTVIAEKRFKVPLQELVKA